MKLKSILALVLLATGGLFFFACGGGENEKKSSGTEDVAKDQAEVHGSLVKAADVTLTKPLNQDWVSEGKKTYDLKCQSCHKLTEDRVVGPGWAGVTTRREPHWIMNMITNVDVMLETDPEAQKLLEQCLVRMPNQNLTMDESREVLEYMRSNDGEK